MRHQSIAHRYYILFFLILLFFISFVRWRLLDFPLERDEGEYAYIGQLILEGYPPYSTAANMKLPGTYYMYALWMSMFGQSAIGIHLGLWIMQFVGILFLFLLIYRRVGLIAAVIAAGIYGLLTLDHRCFGFAAHATQFLTAFILAGLYWLDKFLSSEKKSHLLWSGLSFGLAILMKQHAALIAFGMGLFLVIHFKAKVWSVSTWIILGLYSCGVLAPYLTISFILYLQGAWSDFWYWTMEYAPKYATTISRQDGWIYFKSEWTNLTQGTVWFWYLAGIGFLAFIFHTSFKQNALFFVFYFVFSFFAVVPGLYFRNHYWIVFFPAVSIAFALGYDTILQGIERYFPNKQLVMILFSASMWWLIVRHIQMNKTYFFTSSVNELSKSIYLGNAFVETKMIADSIRSQSRITDKITVIGSDPEIYFYSQRKAATKHLYSYGILNHPEVNTVLQNEMKDEIVNNQPTYIVLCPYSAHWSSDTSNIDHIIPWTRKYVQQNYSLIMVVDAPLYYPPIFKSGTDAQTYTPQSAHYFLVYKKL